LPDAIRNAAVDAARFRIERRSTMKAPLGLIGIALIALGLIALVYQGITYTTREKAVDLGPLKITAQKRRRSRCPRSWGASRWWAASSWSSPRCASR
jgi:hypothetical protein